MNYVFESPEGHSHVLRDDTEDGYRLVAHPTQADFISRLKKEDFKVEVISVNLVDPKNSKDVNSILEAMRSAPIHPPEQGGWREITEYEHAALNFSIRLINPCSINTLFISDLLKMHPLIRQGVMFATGGNINNDIIGIMGEVFDILRFNNRKHDKWTKLCEPTRTILSFFKLTTPVEIARALKGQMPTCQEGFRAHVALRAWSSAMCEDPGCKDCGSSFLTRCRNNKEYLWVQSLCGGVVNNYDVEVLGWWNGTRLFIEFIRRLWTAGVSNLEFKPEDFFEKEDEVESFKLYIKELNDKLDNSWDFD